MKLSCVIMSALVMVAIMAVCVMVKFATDVTVEERKRELLGPTGNIHQLARSVGVVALHEGQSLQNMAERFPYLAAITINSTTSWNFACFGSIILMKWVVTAAHCRVEGATHRVLLLSDLAKNFTKTHPVVFWRIHDQYKTTDVWFQYDIAIAKLNIESYPYTLKSSAFDDKKVVSVQASIWKTVATMDQKKFLTNDVDVYEMKIVNSKYCLEAYGVLMDESVMCVDMARHADCFVHDFGPLFDGNKVAGVLALQPRDCDNKLAVFTNVSFYATWILRLTHDT